MIYRLLHWTCDYLYMLGFKLIHVSKKALVVLHGQCYKVTYIQHTQQLSLIYLVDLYGTKGRWQSSPENLFLLRKLRDKAYWGY